MLTQTPKPAIRKQSITITITNHHHHPHHPHHFSLTASTLFPLNGRHTTPEPPRPNPPQPIHPNPHHPILLLRHLHLLHCLPFLDQSRLRGHSIHILAETPYHTD